MRPTRDHDHTNKLALRKQSIRTLTTAELAIAHGGENGTVVSNGTTTLRTAPPPPTK